ncbi:MAG: hypothetical protein JXA74_09475, partial [Anaerolineae bacterium]|nr:hypothetical protein [Anaerolineae bacterium]
MRSTQRAAIACLLLVSLILSLTVHVTADGPIELTIYSSPTCEDCAQAKEQVLDPLKEIYGELVHYDYVDLSTSEGLAELERIEEQFGRPNSPLPVIVYGDQLIADMPPEELKAALEGLILRELTGSGGPDATPAARTAPSQAVGPNETTAVSEKDAAIHLAYVEQAGCQECARAQLVIDAL